MKYFITAALSCLIISANCQQQPATTIESTLVPNSYLRNAAAAIEKGKLCEERVNLLNEKISFLNQRIAIKDSIIQVHGDKDSTQARIKKTYQDEIANLKEQKDIATKEMKHQNKLYRRQKRKLVFAVLGTAAVTAAVMSYFNL